MSEILFLHFIYILLYIEKLPNQTLELKWSLKYKGLAVIFTHEFYR